MIDTGIDIIDTNDVGAESFYESRIKLALARVLQRVNVDNKTPRINDALPALVGISYADSGMRSSMPFTKN
jgi:hypothetical protein